MPNLLVATGIFHPEPGGPSTYLMRILPALQARGWAVRLVTYGDSAADDYPFLVRRVKRVAYPLRLARYNNEIRQHAAWADLTYAHTIDLPLWGVGGPRALKVVGDQAWERCVRKRWIPPDMTIDQFQSYRGGWRARWQQASRACQARSMQAVIAPSRYLCNLIRGWGVAAEKLHLIYNALPPIANAASFDRAAIRAELGWDKRPRLLTVARLQPWKGIDYLIAALAYFPDLHLVVVGAGPDLSRLRALAAHYGGRVDFAGYLPSAQAHKLMAAADGLALYSAYEGLSHTLLECLQLGTPVLASDRGGNPELLRHGSNGLLVPYADLGALRQGIERLLRQRDQFAANATVDMQRFSFDNMARQTDKLLKSLLR